MKKGETFSIMKIMELSATVKYHWNVAVQCGDTDMRCMHTKLA